MWTAKTTLLLSIGVLITYHQLDSRALLPSSLLRISTGVLENLIAFGLLFSIITCASNLVRNLYESYRANKLGAIKVPVFNGWLPGNLDLLFSLAQQDATKEPGESTHKMHEKLGPLFMLRLMGSQIAITLDASHMQRILAGNFENFGKPVDFIDSFRDILGEGVFNSDQKGLWKWHRTLTRPHFAREEVFNYNHFLRHADNLVNLFVNRAKTGSPIDVQEAFGAFTSDSGTALFFGKEFGALARLSGESQDGKEFWDAFMGAQSHGCKRLDRGGALWRAFELFGLYNPNAENMRIIRRTLDSVIEEALKAPRDKDDPKKEKTLLMHLVSETQDIKLIRDELLNILVAARDTTASLLTSITSELARHPEAFTKLKSELMEVIGDDPNHVPTYEELKGCPYTRAVVQETLRMWPPVYFNVRFAWNEDVWTVNGTRYYIPPQTTCSYAIGTMQKSQSTWGPDAGEWIPERWLDDRIKMMTSQPFVFQPFSAGPRICLGQKFALNETTFALARMMQRINSISLAPDAQPAHTILPNGEVSKYTVLTLAYRGGLWVRFGTNEK